MCQGCWTIRKNRNIFFDSPRVFSLSYIETNYDVMKFSLFHHRGGSPLASCLFLMNTVPGTASEVAIDTFVTCPTCLKELKMVL